MTNSRASDPARQNPNPIRRRLNVKRIVETNEEGGFTAVLGEPVVLLCGVYIYAGILAGVNDDHLELTDPKLVYDTGAWNASDWTDAQSLPSPHRVMRQAIESWGPGKC